MYVRSTAAARIRREWPRALVVVLMLSGYTIARPSSRANAQSRVIEVDVIGDSLSTGLATRGEAWTSNAERLFLAARRDVQFVNAAENGAGYVASGQNGDTFVDEVNQIVSDRAQIVLMFGSDNDLDQPGLAASIAQTMSRVRALAPRAKLIVVGPPAPPAQDAQQLEGVRDTLQAASRQAGVQFVDPLALKWFQDAASAGVGPDSEHPNDSGKQYLAEQMTAILTPEIDADARLHRADAPRRRTAKAQQISRW